MHVRPATDADWPQILPLLEAVAAEGATYALPDPLTPDRARAVWMPPPPSLTVVANTVAADDPGAAGTLLGSATVGPNRPGRGAHVATASFVVAPAARGRGVGRGLAEWALDHARREGYRAMQFNAVVETNTAAVALWHSLGFSVIGTVPAAFDHRERGPVGLHVMHRFL